MLRLVFRLLLLLLLPNVEGIAEGRWSGSSKTVKTTFSSSLNRGGRGWSGSVR